MNQFFQSELNDVYMESVHKNTYKSNMAKGINRLTFHPFSARESYL